MTYQLTRIDHNGVSVTNYDDVNKAFYEYGFWKAYAETSDEAVKVYLTGIGSGFADTILACYVNGKFLETLIAIDEL